MKTTHDFLIGVSGASGRLGSATILELRTRANGARLIGISRTPEKPQETDENRPGDYDAPDTLAKAYAGLDRLLIIPSAELRPGKRAEQNLRAIDAAVMAGVNQIVLLSSVGTRDVAEPDFLASYYLAEQRLMRTAPAWTVLRMTSFSEEFAREAHLSLSQGALVGLGHSCVSYVSRADVAASVAGLLLSDGHSGAIYNLTGSTSLTGPERAQVVAEATGTPMVYRLVSKDAHQANLSKIGLPEEVVAAVMSIQEHFTAGAFDIVTGDVERLSGKLPRPLLDTLRSELLLNSGSDHLSRQLEKTRRQS